MILILMYYQYKSILDRYLIMYCYINKSLIYNNILLNDSVKVFSLSRDLEGGLKQILNQLKLFSCMLTKQIRRSIIVDFY